jgi:chromodomain-helicase-DNA-binding protein 7
MDVDSDEKQAEPEEKAATSAKKKAEDSSEEKTSPVKAEKVKSEEPKAARTIQVDEYLVKFKNFSYLHCQWQTEAELLR